MNEFLFIGGSCDGRRLRCEDGCSVVRVVKQRPLGAPLMRHTEDLGRETEDYRRCSFTSGGDTLFVYVAPSVADKDIMAALIAGYSRGPDAPDGKGRCQVSESLPPLQDFEKALLFLYLFSEESKAKATPDWQLKTLARMCFEGDVLAAECALSRATHLGLATPPNAEGKQR